MSTILDPQRRALVVVFAGIALTVSGSVLVFLTHEPVWRYLLAGGLLVQFIGWALYSGARRGGER